MTTGKITPEQLLDQLAYEDYGMNAAQVREFYPGNSKALKARYDKALQALNLFNTGVSLDSMETQVTMLEAKINNRWAGYDHWNAHTPALKKPGNDYEKDRRKQYSEHVNIDDLEKKLRGLRSAITYIKAKWIC